MISLIIKKLRSKKGFTLVELIVVVAILAIIATVAIPKVIGFSDDARAARDATNEQLVRNAAALWIAENNLPTGTDTEDWNGGSNQGWEKYLDEWPTGITSVSIDKDGNITVTP